MSSIAHLMLTANSWICDSSMRLHLCFMLCPMHSVPGSLCLHAQHQQHVEQFDFLHAEWQGASVRSEVAAAILQADCRSVPGHLLLFAEEGSGWPMHNQP